jgi:hypothetical protein
MVEFCNECEINSDDEEDFIDTTLKIFFNKIQKKIFLKNTEEGVNEKILSDAELKIIFNTRVIPNWNTYEDFNNYGSMCRS